MDRNERLHRDTVDGICTLISSPVRIRIPFVIGRDPVTFKSLIRGPVNSDMFPKSRRNQPSSMQWRHQVLSLLFFLSGNGELVIGFPTLIYAYRLTLL